MMKKIFFVSIGLAILMLVFTGCAGGPPSENELKKLLPEEVLNYTIDGITYTSNVESLTIDKRKTTDDSDYVECMVVLADENVVRNITMSIFLSFYDVGDWQIDHYQITDSKTSEIRIEGDLERLKNYIAESGYSVTSDDWVESTPGRLDFSGTLQTEQYTYLDFSGKINAIATLNEVSDPCQMPMSYNWEVEMIPQIDCDWKLLGNFQGDIGDYRPAIAIEELMRGEYNDLILSGLISSFYDTVSGETDCYGPIDFQIRATEEVGTSAGDTRLSATVSGIQVSYIIFVHADYAQIGRYYGVVYDDLFPLQRIDSASTTS